MPARCSGSGPNSRASETSRADWGAGARGGRHVSARRETDRCPEAGRRPGGNDCASGANRASDQEAGWQSDLGHAN